MLILLRQFLHDLLYSPEKATLWVRAFAGFVFGVLATIVMSSAGPDGVPDLVALKSWGWRGWAVRFLVSAVLSVALAFKAGEKNLDPERRARAQAALDGTPQV